jgi:Asp-tRNA(Asn)/Glu-tRNA(Gln) amidotransferase A subunit family amidase
LRSLLETSEAIRAGRLSPVEVTEECLARIARLNPRVNAFITVTADCTREQARKAEREVHDGKWRGPLHGIPIGLKDLVDTAGILTTAGSQLYAQRVPSKSARVWKKLESAGAVLLGKQNLHEFAYGGSSVISAYGPVRNPWNVEAIAGGSSGGSATAVALGMGFAAIGTDTAGSIREPAALCGVVGLKPTYGRVSAEGVIALSPSLDHVGPITRNVVDAAVVLEAISEPALPPDAMRTTSSGDNLVDLIRQSPHGLRIGVPREYFFAELDVDVDRAIEQALAVVRPLVAEVRDVVLHPDTDRTLQAAESYEIHARSIAESPELYQPETLRRLKTGENSRRERLDEARRALRLARQEIARVFDEVDLLITPTTPIAAPSIADLAAHPDRLRPAEIQLLRNTRPFNVWGLPAISVPCGFTRSGLPIGLQIAGAPWNEDLVLRLAYAYEQATEWHLRFPAIAAWSS